MYFRGDYMCGLSVIHVAQLRFFILKMETLKQSRIVGLFSHYYYYYYLMMMERGESYIDEFKVVQNGKKCKMY